MDIKVDTNTVIVFDLDDTLYNEIDFLKSAYIEISKEFEKQQWQNLYTRLLSLYRNKHDVFEYLATTYNIDKNNLIQRYRNHIPKIKPFEGVVEVFKKIKVAEGKIAVITDGRKVTQMNKLQSLGLLSFIDYIVISEEIGSEKPNELNFKAVENYFNRKIYYYIADNYKKDFIAPNKLGWQSVALIDNGLNIHAHAHTYYQDKFIPRSYILNFKELNIK